MSTHSVRERKLRDPGKVGGTIEWCVPILHPCRQSSLARSPSASPGPGSLWPLGHGPWSGHEQSQGLRSLEMLEAPLCSGGTLDCLVFPTRQPEVLDPQESARPRLSPPPLLPWRQLLPTSSAVQGRQGPEWPLRDPAILRKEQIKTNARDKGREGEGTYQRLGEKMQPCFLATLPPQLELFPKLPDPSHHKPLRLAWGSFQRAAPSCILWLSTLLHLTALSSLPPPSRTGSSSQTPPESLQPLWAA